MRFQHLGYQVRGFYRVGNYALRWGMVSEQACQRLKILVFWERHGLDATRDAFGVSRRTLYGWRQRYRQGSQSVVALEPQSRAPKRRRQRHWPTEVIDEIKRLRAHHPNLGKAKLYPLLERFCAAHRLACPSERTIGRLIADQPGKLRQRPVRLGPKGQRRAIRHRDRQHKPKHFRATFPGQCVALDTIERFQDGLRRSVITLTDLHSRFAFALATTSHASRAAAQFFTLAQTAFPQPVQTVLTDNGCEFARHFAQALAKQELGHWHTYPRTPKMNAHVERFNRTLQEEFIDYHEPLLFTDLLAFNDALFDYLLWFNGERPHYSLDQHPPIECLISTSPQQCKMYWPHTTSCHTALHTYTMGAQPPHPPAFRSRHAQVSDVADRNGDRRALDGARRRPRLQHRGFELCPGAHRGLQRRRRLPAGRQLRLRYLLVCRRQLRPEPLQRRHPHRRIFHARRDRFGGPAFRHERFHGHRGARGLRHRSLETGAEHQSVSGIRGCDQ
ncbi:MAG: DDE-type integrase/transposase/recombinase [Gammaproteobacteria bacterium]|nr:DDE-type integrase/transposase/recombinase [Gammaproteobacteria bacterium]MDE2461502.1 DDE-type integrase/transposase/recombinase [Gammaproteobacteria bacterium]